LGPARYPDIWKKSLRAKKLVLGLPPLTRQPVRVGVEAKPKMHPIYGKALFRTLRDTHRVVRGCPSIERDSTQLIR
jgi:hypothetical protein